MVENVLKWRSHLVIGGARSGKTSYAMRLAMRPNVPRWIIVTAEVSDPEMEDRITQHRAERDENWQVVEEPFALLGALDMVGRSDRIVVVDCLTVWLSNLFFKEMDYLGEVSRLTAWLAKCSARVILVSNELGMGIVPETSLGRRFRDAHGRMNQNLAAICDRVTLVAAGLPLVLKSDA